MPSPSSPKKPQEILIRIINRAIEDGLASGIATTAEVPLTEKLDDYLLRLGYSSAYTMEIMVQLLTKGKVRVDFREYTERLELVDPQDAVSAAEAASLLESYIAATTRGDDSYKKATSTQRILIQPARSQRKREDA